MHTSGFGVPLLVRADGTTESLKSVSPSRQGENGYDERWLQELLFRHPEILPITEIDDSFSGLIPLCMEMSTPAGEIDAVYVTPSGRLALLEAKLWRNPESRREIIGQILDYAKELPSWDYSRLENAVRQARKNEKTTAGENFPGIFEHVVKTHPGLEQIKFHDAVTKSLAAGKFLLLVAGDGIREGVGAIAQYLDRNGSLHFTFGLIQCSIYDAPGGVRYVQPRVLAQTALIPRTVFFSGESRVVATEADAEEREASEVSPELIESHAKYGKFWGEFLNKLHVEAAQTISKPAKSTNQFFRLPKGSDGWVSAYLGQSRGEAGVYLTFWRGEMGDRIFAALQQDREEINKALGVDVDWYTKEGGHTILIKKHFRGELLSDSREAVQEWLADHTERSISVFRPRVDQFLREQV